MAECVSQINNHVYKFKIQFNEFLCNLIKIILMVKLQQERKIKLINHS